jgi:hypothetical protein
MVNISDPPPTALLTDRYASVQQLILRNHRSLLRIVNPGAVCARKQPFGLAARGSPNGLAAPADPILFTLNDKNMSAAITSKRCGLLGRSPRRSTWVNANEGWDESACSCRFQSKRPGDPAFRDKSTPKLNSCIASRSSASGTVARQALDSASKVGHNSWCHADQVSEVPRYRFGRRRRRLDISPANWMLP